MTVIYGGEVATPKTAARPAALLPLLVILFIVSYGILTMLVFEQGQTIESQRSLIREMLKDNTKLATLKGKTAHDDAQVPDKASGPTDGTEVKSGKTAAGAKAADKAAKHPGKSAHSMNRVPQKPAADLEDVRRLTQVI